MPSARLLFIDFTLPFLLRDSEYPVGGWAVQLKNWIDALTAAGHRCGVLTWKGANAYAGPQPDCDLLETYDPKAGLKVVRYAYLRIPALIRSARAWRPDVIVQSTSSLETGIMAFVARRLGVPFVYRVASDIDADNRLSTWMPGYARAAYRYGLRRADLIVCQNSYQASLLGRTYRSARLHVQPNIFPLLPNAGAPRPRSSRRYIAWLGVFGKPKNLPLLYRVAEKLPEIEFRIGGMPARNMDSASAQAIEGLRALPNVQFAGYLRRSEVGVFLAEAVALLCTSHYEGFSNTFLEAFAAGTPVITRKGVDPDSIISKNGLGFVAEDDDHLLVCIRDLHAMSAARFEYLSDACAKHVEIHHAPAPIMQSFIEAMSGLTPAARGA